MGARAAASRCQRREGETQRGRLPNQALPGIIGGCATNANDAETEQEASQHHHAQCACHHGTGGHRCAPGHGLHRRCTGRAASKGAELPEPRRSATSSGQEGSGGEGRKVTRAQDSSLCRRRERRVGIAQPNDVPMPNTLLRNSKKARNLTARVNGSIHSRTQSTRLGKKNGRPSALGVKRRRARSERLGERCDEWQAM
jgi:hypothetical protein